MRIRIRMRKSIRMRTRTRKKTRTGAGTRTRTGYADYLEKTPSPVGAVDVIATRSLADGLWCF